MEKYVRVSDIGKDHAKVYTAEEIADSVRGKTQFIWNGTKWICDKCGCAVRDPVHFCGYCGAKA